MDNEDLVGLLKELQALPKECEWVEFKVNNYNPQEIGEYLSALSNSACYNNTPYGFLVFGVENDTHNLVGTSFFPSKEKIGNQEIENWLATQLNPRVDFNLFQFSYQNLNFVILRVDATSNTPVVFRGVAYIRIGSYKKSLNDHPERERKIWNKSNKIFEKEISKERLSGDEVLKLIDYPGFFDLLKIPLPNNIEGILEKLGENKIILKINSRYSITNLGAILFAKNIELFEDLSRKAVRVIIYQGTSRIKTQKEQTGIKGYALGFEGMINFINDKLPSEEIIGKAFREEKKIYPMLAIRELLANAIIHQDFSLRGVSPMVEIFDNRIEITNPGKPIIDILRFVDHAPESRNELLAKFMRRLHICEERGSGIDKVIFECEVHQLPAPDFIVGDNYTRVILYGPQTLRQMDRKDKIRACYLHCCLKYVSGEYMTNQSLRERFGVDDKNYPMISRIISDAKEEGFVKDYDPENRSRTHTKYLPFWA